MRFLFLTLQLYCNFARQTDRLSTITKRMIHLKDINKTYQGAQPLHVLKGISLDIAQGEFVSIMVLK